jgi:L-fuconolactonase
VIIDAHQHFWQLERGDYGWLTPELAPLYQDFMPDDLAPFLARNKVGGTVLVQAAPTVCETEFLLNVADETPFVLGVVGWVDFASQSAAKDIARLARHPKLVGLRPMIQDIADDDWMLDAVLTPAFNAMIEHNLTFDALVLPRHLSRLGTLMSRHPKLNTIIDHGAKPEIAGGAFEKWAEDIAIIANESSAYCKLSGLLTEAADTWTREKVAPYVQHLFASFGPERLIWGSDWPVLTLASNYREWHDLAVSFTQSEAEKRMIFGVNALLAYERLEATISQPE